MEVEIGELVMSPAKNGSDRFNCCLLNSCSNSIVNSRMVSRWELAAHMVKTKEAEILLIVLYEDGICYYLAVSGLFI
jgi:hypothetical protein